MASFTGSFDDFDKFIGPRLRNIVQTSIARKYKKGIGKCEHCDTTDNLQAAHVHGRDRKNIIKQALEEYLNGEQLNDVDLIQFEEKFCQLHQPLKENFLILCVTCHRNYDNLQEDADNDENIEEFDADDLSNNNAEVLPIELYPNNVDEFKELFLQHQSAIITICYNNGTFENREWRATRFRETSNVMHNLRSRIPFRQGNWQESGILKVLVTINY